MTSMIGCTISISYQYETPQQAKILLTLVAFILLWEISTFIVLFDEISLLIHKKGTMSQAPKLFVHLLGGLFGCLCEIDNQSLEGNVNGVQLERDAYFLIICTETTS